MELNEKQIEDFHSNGYLFCESLLAREEVAVLHRELKAILQTDREEIVRELDRTTLRSIFNLHNFNDAFSRLSRHPRIVGPAMQLLGGPVYAFQLVLNFKAAFNGDQWPWHQDFPTYRADDGLPEPRLVNSLIFMDEVHEFNGPLMLIPGSHRCKFPLSERSSSKTSYPGRWLPEKYVREIALERGIVAPKGPQGSVIFAHTNIIHGSNSNMSPWARYMISYTLNAVSNRPLRESSRPDFKVPRNRAVVEPLGEDCLLDT